MKTESLEHKGRQKIALAGIRTCTVGFEFGPKSRSIRRLSDCATSATDKIVVYVYVMLPFAHASRVYCILERRSLERMKWTQEAWTNGSITHLNHVKKKLWMEDWKTLNENSFIAHCLLPTIYCTLFIAKFRGRYLLHTSFIAQFYGAHQWFKQSCY